MNYRYRLDQSNAREALAAWLASEPAGRPVDTPAALLPHLLPHLTDGGAPLERERVVVVALNHGLSVVDVAAVSEGNHRSTVVCPVQILRWVLTREKLATCFVVAHNHPSGDPTPSAEDIAVTRRLRKAATAVGLNLMDHIVVGSGGNYTSIRTERSDLW